MTSFYIRPGHCENAEVSCPGEGFRGKDCKCYCRGNPIKECDTSEENEDTGESASCFLLVLLGLTKMDKMRR